MRPFRTSGSMSGEWKRSKVGYSGTGHRKSQPPLRPTYPTAPLLDSTRENHRFCAQKRECIPTLQPPGPQDRNS
jgi:hypothetical protein